MNAFCELMMQVGKPKVFNYFDFLSVQFHVIQIPYLIILVTYIFRV